MTDKDVPVITPFEPTDEGVVIATTHDFDEEVITHLVRGSGEEDRAGLKLAHLVKQDHEGNPVVTGQVFYKIAHELDPVEIQGIGTDIEVLPYEPTNLPCLGEVLGKPIAELELEEFAWHQGSPSQSFDNAMTRFRDAATEVLTAYLKARADDKSSGIVLALTLAPNIVTFTHTSAESVDELVEYIEQEFKFRIAGDHWIDCGFETPWGFISIERMTAYDLTNEAMPLNELADLSQLLLRFRYTHEDFIEKLEDAAGECDCDEAAELTDEERAAEDAELEEVMEQAINEDTVGSDDLLVAANPSTSPERLVELLLKSQSFLVRAAAVSNPVMPNDALYAYARRGGELDTRLGAIQEINKRS